MIVEACDGCLRRTDLIAALAGRIEVEWLGRRGRPQLLALDDEELLEWARVPEVRERYRGFSAATARAAVAAAGLTALCRCEDGYPVELHDLPDPPAVLHVRGRLPVAGEDAVVIVGARRATAYGTAVAHGLGRSLAAAGVTVVSGMALGVDSAAHAGALEASGRTVAVMACGADRSYPARKLALHRQIGATGAVVSELPPGSTPFRWAFPARNRTIAALGRATVVVEATERSGSLITADLAAEIGRPVAAVPGPVTSTRSAGTNLLLKTGAEVVCGAQDVLDLLFGAGARAAPSRADQEDLPPDLRRLLVAVRDGRGSAGELAAGGDAFAVAAGLGELEMRGLLRRTTNGTYVAVLD